MKNSLFLLVIFMFTYGAITAQNATMNHEGAKHVMVNSSDLKWVDAPPGLPKGAQVTVLAGDPSKEGMFTLRAIFPANYKVPPHWHPTTENVSVLEGTLYMGGGETFDESKTTALKEGGFASIPEKTAHYVFTKKKCMIQIHAMGPFEITYYNAADDPRTK